MTLARIAAVELSTGVGEATGVDSKKDDDDCAKEILDEDMESEDD